MNISFSQEWIKTDITDFASIEFPVNSDLIEAQGETVFTAEDEFAYYIVSIRELNTQQSSQITQKDIPNLYQGVAQGTVDAANGEVVSMDEIIVQNIPALELVYNVEATSDLPSKRFKRIIYFNQNIISIDYWPKTNQNNISIEKKKTFFNSFTLNSSNIKKTSIGINAHTQNNDDRDANNTADETGFFVGKIFFYFLLFAVLFGIILLIWLLGKKNKNKQVTNTSKTHNTAKPSTIICGKCETENYYDSKYCKKCGYQLAK